MCCRILQGLSALILGVILATELDQSSEIRLAIDIGTNGEMVLGNKDRICWPVLPQRVPHLKEHRSAADAWYSRRQILCGWMMI